MINFSQKGDILDLTAPAGGVVSGTVYKIGSIVCVAVTTAAAGETFAALTEGVVSLPVGSDTPAEGGKAYFKSDNTISTTASGNTLCGAFVGAKDASNNALVKLTGQVV